MKLCSCSVLRRHGDEGGAGTGLRSQGRCRPELLATATKCHQLPDVCLCTPRHTCSLPPPQHTRHTYALTRCMFVPIVYGETHMHACTRCLWRKLSRNICMHFPGKRMYLHAHTNCIRRTRMHACTRCHMCMHAPGITYACTHQVSHMHACTRCHICIHAPGVAYACTNQVSHMHACTRCRICMHAPGVTYACMHQMSHMHAHNRCHICMHAPGVTCVTYACMHQVSHMNARTRCHICMHAPGATYACTQQVSPRHPGM